MINAIMTIFVNQLMPHAWPHVQQDFMETKVKQLVSSAILVVLLVKMEQGTIVSHAIPGFIYWFLLVFFTVLMDTITIPRISFVEK